MTGLTHAALLLTLLLAQKKASDAVVTVQGPEPGVVRLGDTSVAAIVVEGVGIGAEIEAPKSQPDLDIRVSGPSQLTQSYFDGRTLRTSLSLSWKLHLKPRKEGSYSIPPVNVKVGSETLSTTAIKLECVKDLSGSNYAFLETRFSKNRYFAHEPARMTLRFGIDKAIRGNMLQLFNRPLDVEVQIEAPWLQEFPGGVAVEGATATGERKVNFAVNQSLAEARPLGEIERGGRAFIAYELERVWLPGRLGTLDLTAPLLRFRYAKRFTQDFFGERVPADRFDAYVYGEPTSIEVVAIPEAGRPRSFSGAVGQFEIVADVTPHQVKVGESLNVKLTITGSGNLEFFEPPSLDGIEGFHVFGKLDDRSKNARTVTFHLAPLVESVKEIPPVEFTYFDTREPAGYKSVRTAALPIIVKPLPPGATLAPLGESDARRFTVGVDDIYDIMPTPEEAIDVRRAPSPLTAILALAAPLAAAGAVLTWLRRRERDAANPARVRARGAIAKFRASSQGTEAFTEYLGDRLGCNAAAVVSDDLELLLTRRGIPADLARQAASALWTAIASRYAAGSPGAPAGFAPLADSLESEFVKLEKSP
jgi:hypothetical protein